MFCPPDGHNAEEQSALSKFVDSIKQVWEETFGDAPSAFDLRNFVNLVRVVSLDVEAGHDDERQAISTLSTIVLQHGDSSKAWAELLQLCTAGATDRRSSTITQIQQSLEDAGLPLATSRSYLADINRLKAVTKRTVRSLKHLASLRARPENVSIHRSVTDVIAANAANSSLLIVGEPGAGKSGVLFELAAKLEDQEKDVVFLAVDRLEGSLKSDLGLDHAVDEALLEWKGSEPGFLIIDALDAARGASASAVVLDLVRAIVESSSRWRVIASIRTFDLKYSPELQDIFRKPFDYAKSDYQNSRFANLHHVSVPVFADSEIAEICGKVPAVATVLLEATPQFAELLRIPFNLRLLCELLHAGMSIGDLAVLHTQTALLNRYWEHRVLSPQNESTSREGVLNAVLEQMEAQRRLSIQKTILPTSIDHDALGALLSNQVLVEQEENVVGRFILCFSHHLLFDYAASRLLILGDPQKFLQQLSLEHDLVLFLRPSILLVFRELWFENRDYYWKLARMVSKADGIPAVARLIAPTVLAEQLTSISDLKPLLESLHSKNAEERGHAEDWLLHAVGTMLADNHVRRTKAWTEFVTQVAAESPATRILGALQALVSMLIEQVPASNHALRLMLNRAAANILKMVIQNTDLKSWLRAKAITDLMKVYSEDPVIASAALRQLFSPGTLQETGFADGPWIARHLRLIFDVDPQFVEDFYCSVFSYDETSDTKTDMGGGQIFSMTSNKRQDYRHMWWELGQIFPQFCVDHPVSAARIVSVVLNSYVQREHLPKEGAEIIRWISDGGEQRQVLSDYSSIWDSGYRDSHEEPLQIASTFFRHLSKLAILDLDFATSIATLILDAAGYAVTIRRLFAIAIEQPGAFLGLLAPICTSFSAFVSLDLSSTIGDFLKVAYPLLEIDRRRAIEIAILEIPRQSPENKTELAIHYRDRLVGCLAEDSLVDERTMAIRRQLAAGDGPPPNDPPFRTGGIVQGRTFSMREYLAEQGVEVDEPANKYLHELTEVFSGFKGVRNNEIPTIEESAELLPQLQRLRHAVDSWQTDGADREQANHAEATLVSVCSSIARNHDLEPSTELGIFVKDNLLKGLDSPIPVHDPSYDVEFDKHQAWGAPAQRIDAAIGLYNLATITDFLDQSLLNALERGLKDASPQVRFQAAIRLTLLQETNVEFMWQLIEYAARSEKSSGVLAGMLSNALGWVAGRYPDQTIKYVALIQQRPQDSSTWEPVREWCLRILVGLYVWQNRLDAYGKFEYVLEANSFDPKAAAQLLLDARGMYTHHSDQAKDNGAGIRARAFELSEKIATLAGAELSRPSLPEDGPAISDRITDCARTLDFIGNQIYFASGAYDGKNQEQVLSNEARAAFWLEAQGVIKALTHCALPSIAHHLIQTLQSFLVFAPAEVFHNITAVVRSAQRWGYQYESMAIDLLVEITELYLAQYPTLLQDDKQCRQELMYVLETFVNAGWPAALRLIYRLEDMYR
jgi:DNA replication protein DnaC